MRKEKDPYMSTSETRNGKVREIADSYSVPFVRKLHEQYPWIKPNHLSVAGLVGVVIGTGILAYSRRRDMKPFFKNVLRVVGAGVFLGGGSLDKGDGDLARIIRTENPESHDPLVGGIVDAVVEDRGQEVLVGLQHALETKNMASVLAAATASMPSFVRAIGEIRGIPSKEFAIGSRAGRFTNLFVGSVMGGRTQTILDGLSAAANVYTAVDRTIHIVKNWNNASQFNLSAEDKKHAFYRAMALGVMNGLAISASAYVGKKINTEAKIQAQTKKENQEHWLTPGGRLEADDLYAQDTERASEIMKEVNGVFVGGTFTDLLNLNTRAKFDFKNRVITLNKHNPHTILREDGTVKDSDAICFEKDPEKVKNAKQKLQDEHKKAEVEERPHSYVNMEPTSFYPGWKKRNTLKQFTSGIDVHNDTPYLVFGDVKKPVSWESLAPWTVQLEDGTQFQTFSPFAHLLRYGMRVPSGLKNKDKEMKTGMIEGNEVSYNKLDLIKLVAKQGAEDAGCDNWWEFWMNYEGGAYKPWIDFIHEMRSIRDIKPGSWTNLVRLRGGDDAFKAFKVLATAIYWDTPIGKTIAHGGNNPTLKWLSEQSGAFTGQK